MNRDDGQTARSGGEAVAGAGGLKRVPTVGIGTSAGGVRALQTFFENLPNDVEAAFVVVVHLDPAHQSELPSILAARTRMPVTQVTGRIRLEARHVYVIPPNRQLLVTDQHLAIAEFDEPRWQRAPIDLFFRSLAAQRGDDFAIVLSGAGSDGSVGIKAVKETGGIILVQDPEEAEYGSMPRSAIATGLADLVLPISEIALRLPELIRNRTSVAVEAMNEADGDVDATDPLAPARPHGTRFLQLQEIDDPPPHRAPHAGAARADDGRLSCDLARKRGRGAGAVRRSPDLGDDVLPRPDGLRQAGVARHSDAVRGQGRGRLDPRLDSQAAPPARKPIRSRFSCSRRRPQHEIRCRDPGLRLRSRRGGARRRPRGPLSARHRSRHDGRPSAALLQPERSITTGSPANCATSCCSPGTAFSRTRHSRAPTSSPAATC